MNRFGRGGEELANLLDSFGRMLTEHTALEDKAVLPLAEKSG
jgi:hypothetical protein